MLKLLIIIRKGIAMPEKMTPVHAGEILSELFLEPAGISPYRLAKDTGLSPTRISQILNGKRGISAETALRFGRYFGNSPEYWLGIQAQYDLAKAEDELRERIESEVTPLEAIG
jgi:addiction module HigA family antidote